MPHVVRTLVALAALGGGLVAAPLGAQRRPITAEEIERAGPQLKTALDAVRSLRPRWLEAPREILQLPGSGNSGQELRFTRIHVYLEDRDQGGLDYLQTVPAERVLQIQWMSTNEAGARFGPSEGPAIVVTLKVERRVAP